MRLSKQSKIRIRPVHFRFYKDPDYTAYVCDWRDPVTGVLTKCTSSTPTDAIRGLRRALKPKYVVTDTTKPWWRRLFTRKPRMPACSVT